MSRYKEGVKTLDQNSLPSSIEYSDHTGISSSIGFSPDNDPFYGTSHRILTSLTAKRLSSNFSTYSSLAGDIFQNISPDGQLYFDRYFLYKFQNRTRTSMGSYIRNGVLTRNLFSSDNTKLLQVYFFNGNYHWYYMQINSSNATNLFNGNNSLNPFTPLCVTNNSILLYSEGSDLTLWDLENDAEIASNTTFDASGILQANQFGNLIYFLYRDPTDQDIHTGTITLDTLTVTLSSELNTNDFPTSIRFDKDTGDYYYILDAGTSAGRVCKNNAVEFNEQNVQSVSDKGDVVQNSLARMNGAYYGANSITNLRIIYTDRTNDHVYTTHNIGSSSTKYFSTYLLIPQDNYKDCTFNGLSGYVRDPGTITGNIAWYGNSRDFYTKTFSISPATNQTYLKASLKFISGLVRTNRNYFVSKTVDSVNRFFDHADTSNTAGFAVKSNTAGTLATFYNQNGDINVKIPEGTTSITLEMVDSELHDYAGYNAPTLNISNIRVYDYSNPSLGILNDTKADNSYEYIELESIASVKVEEEDENGFYDIILDPQENDYFFVGDKFHEINYRPLNIKRNACLQFSTLDLSDVDDDHPIELLLDVVDLDTSYAQDIYNNFGVRESEVDEFYKNGGKVGILPLVAIGSFPTSVTQVHAGSTNGIYATPYNVGEFKCGLQTYDITTAVNNSILNGQSNILVWLFYDQLYTRDQFNVFKVGSSELNRPRIRYKKNA